MPFIFEILRYSFCACVRNILKIVTFVIEKMKLTSFSLFLDAFPPPPPPRPKMPFGQLNVAIQIYNICKGRLWSRGESGRTSERRHQISDKIDTLQDGRFLLYFNCINSFTVYSVIGRLVPLFNGLVPIYVTE